MNPRFLLLAAVFAPLAFAAESDAPSAFNATLGAGKVHEECMRLAKGEKRRYEWKSSTPLDFNIHYHDGNEVFYPVKRDGVGKGKGTFKAKVAQDYCWMWTAKTPAKIEGRIRK